MKDSISENGSIVGETWLKPGLRPRNPDAVKCPRACWEPPRVTYSERNHQLEYILYISILYHVNSLANYLSDLECSGISFSWVLWYLPYFSTPEATNELACRWGLASGSLVVTASLPLKSSESFWKLSWHFYYLKYFLRSETLPRFCLYPFFISSLCMYTQTVSWWWGLGVSELCYCLLLYIPNPFLNGADISTATEGSHITMLASLNSVPL